MYNFNQAYGAHIGLILYFLSIPIILFCSNFLARKLKKLPSRSYLTLLCEIRSWRVCVCLQYLFKEHRPTDFQGSVYLNSFKTFCIIFKNQNGI